MSLATFNYTVNGLSTGSCAGPVLVGDQTSVIWSVNGDPGYDTCYVAIRPLNDLGTDDSIVTGSCRRYCALL